MLRLDGRRRVPLYHQLKELVRANVGSGVWAPGYRLANEFALGRQFGVSRTTVRQALSELRQEGVIQSWPGRGTFVVGPKPEASLARLQDVTQGLLAPGPGSAHRTISQRIVVANAGIARTLAIPVRSRVVELVRLRTERGESVILEKYHMPASRVPRFESWDVSDHMLYSLLQHHYGISIRRAKTWLEPTNADDYEAKLLSIPPRTPCLLIRRLLEDASGPVISSKLLLRGDRCKYVISWESA